MPDDAQDMDWLFTAGFAAALADPALAQAAGQHGPQLLGLLGDRWLGLPGEGLALELAEHAAVLPAPGVLGDALHRLAPAGTDPRPFVAAELTRLRSRLAEFSDPAARQAAQERLQADRMQAAGSADAAAWARQGAEGCEGLLRELAAALCVDDAALLRWETDSGRLYRVSAFSRSRGVAMPLGAVVVPLAREAVLQRRAMVSLAEGAANAGRGGPSAAQGFSACIPVAGPEGAQYALELACPRFRSHRLWSGHWFAALATVCGRAVQVYLCGAAEQRLSALLCGADTIESILATSDSAAAAGIALVRQIQRRARLPWAAFAAVSPCGERLLLHGCGPQGESAPARQPELPLRGAGMLSLVLSSRRPSLWSDTQRDAGGPGLGPIPARSQLALPLVVGPETAGVIVLQSHLPCAFSTADLEAAHTAVSALGLALQQRRLDERDQRRAAQIRVIGETAALLRFDADEQQIGELGAQMLARKFGYPEVSYHTVDWERGESVESFVPASGALRRRAWKLAELGVIALVAAGNRPYRSGQANQDPRFVPGERSDTLSEIAAPVAVDGRVLGVLNVESNLANAFDATDEEALVAMAGALGHAMKSARLVREAGREAEAQGVLGAIMRAGLEESGATRATGEALRQLLAAAGCTCGMLVIQEGRGTTPRVAALQPAERMAEAQEALAGLRLAAESPSVVQVTPQVTGDALVECARAFGQTSMLELPVRLDADRKGWFVIGSTAAGAFSAPVIGRLANLVARMAPALNNTLLVSRLVETQGELDRKAAELDRLAYTLSHDMRAPVISVQGYTELLRDLTSNAGEQAHYYLDRIDANARRMVGLINGLIELARVNQGDWEPARTNMHAALEEALEDVAGALAAREGDVRVEGALPPAMAHPLLARQVWQNLVGNALRYARKEVKPEIVIRGELCAGRACYSVQDNGQGIAAEELEHIFELFHRAGRVDGGGSGLGLAIVRRIIDRLNGTISVTSRANAGTTFTFSFPAVPTRESARLEPPGK
ncbi:MAG: GAF domain-containing sensor histidine kinase [Planctomycetes bacterium]|nr:GAF domain-containing sensor histidine kinase [Planctomycetota bacterium]